MRIDASTTSALFSSCILCKKHCVTLNWAFCWESDTKSPPEDGLIIPHRPSHATIHREQELKRKVLGKQERK